jgi:hypothetical protein
LETRISKTFTDSGDKKISNVDFIAITGTLTDRNVEQHVHVKTETRGSGRNKSVNTSTSHSYTTSVSLIDEHGEAHEINLPGKSFSCPQDGLLTFVKLINQETESGCKYAAYTHHNDQFYILENKSLASDLSSIPGLTKMLIMLAALIGFVGTAVFVFLALSGRTSEFVGYISMAGAAAAVGGLLYIPYYKVNSRFNKFVIAHSKELLDEVAEKTKSVATHRPNPQMDALRNISS